MRIGTVSQIWRYPVKSMAGEKLESATLTTRGIPGDRGWATFDEARSGVSNGKRLPALRLCRARYAHEPVAGAASPPAEIVFPDGAIESSESPAAAQRLSELFGRRITLRGLGPTGTESAPRLTMAGEKSETVRELMGVLPDEPMADMTGLAGDRLLQLRQGNFFDAYPIHLLTRTTLRTLEQIAPESIWDERRFRMNLLVDLDELQGYPEMAWVGRRVRIGAAVIEVAMGCPRCVMATQATDELQQDHRIMRTLVRESKHIAGIYAAVVEEGAVRVGDGVELVK